MTMELQTHKPTRDYLSAGRFHRGRVYTIRKPSFLVKDETGRTVAVIQTFPRSSYDDGVMQYGEEKPLTLTPTLVYHLTGYKNGVAADAPQNRRDAFASAINYCFGPDHALMANVDRLTVESAA